MGEVISISDRGQAEELEITADKTAISNPGGGYLAGRARCLSCKEEWISVSPVGSLWLECPCCGLEKGRLIFPILRDFPHWICNCGNDLFRVTEEGYYCPNCGVWGSGF